MLHQAIRGVSLVIKSQCISNSRKIFSDDTKINYYNNSLNLIRLLAALKVFYGHAVTHLNLSVPIFTDRLFSLFSGVTLFFFISGYLMWNSVDRTPNIKQYLKKRVLRLYPELWCGVALSLISVFILYDEIVPRDIGLFAITQSTFMQFWTPDSLRGFGVGTPNGSLWTICVIVQFYIIAWFIKPFMKKYKSLILWVSVLALLIAFNVLSPKIVELLPEVMGKLYVQTFIPHVWLFMLGAFVCEYFEKIVPFLKRFWWVLLIAFYVQQYIGIDIVGASAVIGGTLSCAFCIAFAYAFPKIQIKYDISYGIYIYHMIVINVVVELGVKGNWGVFAVVLAITVALASLSYHFVGNRCRIERKI